MSYLEYFPAHDPITIDAPPDFNYPTYRSYDMAQNYIEFYAKEWGHFSTNYTTGFTRKIHADDAGDVNAAYNELMDGTMAGKQGEGANTSTSIFCLSYSSSRLDDGNYGLSQEDWNRALAIAAQTGNTSVVLWIDILDRANRTHPWGEEQLRPYLIYPVIFTAKATSKVKQEGLRMWPAIEATMGQLGAGLITDNIARNCGTFIPFQAHSRGLYYSMTVAHPPKVEREALDLHIASGKFRGCPTFHQGHYNRILSVLQVISPIRQDGNGDYFSCLERLEFRFNGMSRMKFEVTSTRWMTTELPYWTGRKEWFPQEGGVICQVYVSHEASKIEGSYQILFQESGEPWLYCLVNRAGKKTIVRMENGDAFGTDGSFRPEKLRPNAYARIPVGKDTSFLGNILGVERLRRLGDNSYDLSKVEWK